MTLGWASEYRESRRIQRIEEAVKLKGESRRFHDPSFPDPLGRKRSAKLVDQRHMTAA
jgi:hypothetical protein